MRKLAEKIEYSPGSVYLYFKNKEELFECLVEESFARLLKTFTTLRNGEERRDPVEEAKKGPRTRRESGRPNPNGYRFALLPWPPRGNPPSQSNGGFEG